MDRLQYTKRSYYVGESATFASIRSSLDSFSSDIDVIAVDPNIIFPNIEELTFDLSSLAIISGTTTFRIYFYAAGVEDGDWDDLTSTGIPGGNGLRLFGCATSLPPIPTLGQWGLIIFGLSLLSIGAISVWQKRASGVKLANK